MNDWMQQQQKRKNHFTTRAIQGRSLLYAILSLSFPASLSTVQPHRMVFCFSFVFNSLSIWLQSLLGIAALQTCAVLQLQLRWASKAKAAQKLLRRRFLFFFWFFFEFLTDKTDNSKRKSKKVRGENQACKSSCTNKNEKAACFSMTRKRNCFQLPIQLHNRCIIASCQIQCGPVGCTPQRL